MKFIFAFAKKLINSKKQENDYSLIAQDEKYVDSIIAKCEKAKAKVLKNDFSIARHIYAQLLSKLEKKAIKTFQESHEVVQKDIDGGLHIINQVRYYLNLYNQVRQYDYLVKEMQKIKSTRIDSMENFSTLKKKDMIHISNGAWQQIAELKDKINQGLIIIDNDLLLEENITIIRKVELFWQCSVDLFNHLTHYHNNEFLYFGWLGFCTLKLAIFTNKKLEHYENALNALDISLKINPDYYLATLYKGRLLIDVGKELKKILIIEKGKILLKKLIYDKKVKNEVKHKAGIAYEQGCVIAKELILAQEFFLDKSQEMSTDNSVKIINHSFSTKSFNKPSTDKYQLEKSNKCSEWIYIDKSYFAPKAMRINPLNYSSYSDVVVMGGDSESDDVSELE
jgi:hypothetical protein